MGKADTLPPVSVRCFYLVITVIVPGGPCPLTCACTWYVSLGKIVFPHIPGPLLVPGSCGLARWTVRGSVDPLGEDNPARPSCRDLDPSTSPVFVHVLISFTPDVTPTPCGYVLDAPISRSKACAACEC